MQEIVEAGMPFFFVSVAFSLVFVVLLHIIKEERKRNNEDIPKIKKTLSRIEEKVDDIIEKYIDIA